MKAVPQLVLVALMATLMTGCMGALFNRVNLTSNRHITIGQELIDLQKAHEAGIISDTEYAEAKRQVLNSLDAFEKFNSDQKEKKK